MRILIADDHRVGLTVLKNILTEKGHEVTTATDGAEALARFREGHFRLVISDWQMPHMTGVELCKTIRAEHTPGYVYIILLTSNDTPEQKVEGLSAGADDFITKPYHPAELVARVHNAERILSLETRDVAIFAMAKLAESRDPETGAHLERVRSYCRVLAEHLATLPAYQSEVTPEFVRLIYLTSPLHDIGKVGIPDAILLKPDRLNDQEFAIMKQHALLGAQTLDASVKAFPGVKFLELARDIAAAHHEQWDGSGYPHGLRGAEIPLAARIMAIADVYDALTTRRVYKGAFAHETARSIIIEGSGTHFDPALVEAFLAVEDSFIRIAQQLQNA